MNTHEEYVSIETAKMLKRAGFDWECGARYAYLNTLTVSYDFIPAGEFFPIENDDELEDLAASTQAVAMRWLREVRKIDIEIVRRYDTDGYEVRYYYAGKYHHVSIEDTYEKAAEEVIQECLKMILNEQEQ